MYCYMAQATYLELLRATAAQVRSPFRSCSGWGLPSQHVSMLLVRSYRTVAPLPVKGHHCPLPSAVYISVALILRVAPTGR